MNTKKLKKLFEASTDKYNDARKMGITYQTLTNILVKGADMKVSTLEKIAKFYNLPVGYFFDEVDAGGKQKKDKEIERLKGQVQALKELVKELRLQK